MVALQQCRNLHCYYVQRVHPTQTSFLGSCDQILTVQLLKSWWLKGRLCPQMSFSPWNWSEMIFTATISSRRGGSKQLDNDHFLLMQTGARHPLSKCEVNPDPTLDNDRGRQGELLLALHEDCHRVGGRGVVGWRWACPLWETINLVLVMIRMWKLLCVRIYIVICFIPWYWNTLNRPAPTPTATCLSWNIFNIGWNWNM